VVHTWGRDHWYTNIFELGGGAAEWGDHPDDAAPAPQQQGQNSRSRSRSSSGNSSRGYYFTRGGTQGGEGVIGGVRKTRLFRDMLYSNDQLPKTGSGQT
jgi:hypothetical protein